jgi:hypothetical protein
MEGHTSRKSLAAALAAVLAFALASPAAGQAPPGPPAGPPPTDRPKVFLDWPGADIGAIGGEIPFVAFVPSLDEAQVRVSVAPQGTPPEGRIPIEFRGLAGFEGQDNRLVYTPVADEKPEDVHKGVVGLLKIGLLRYAAKTPLAEDLSVEFLDQAKPTSVVDKWRFWVFSLSANAFLMGETQYQSGSYYGSISANRTTPELKVRTSVSGEWSRSKFDLGDGEVYESRSHGYAASALVAKSLGEHWSVGGFLSAQSSTYSNLDLSLTAAPAIEYDLFPYSESTKRQLRVLYRIGFLRARYREETVYFKTAESLLQESLIVAYEVIRPWGNVRVQLQGSHFFRDVKFNRLELDAGLEFRVWRGLSFDINGSYARIRDQLALPAGGASYEEILLRQRQLATGYNYSFSAGFNFSFGSTRSNVVNPRFGNGGRSISISM